MDKELAKFVMELEEIVRDLALCLRDVTQEQTRMSSQLRYLWEEVHFLWNVDKDFEVDKDNPM